MSFVILVLISHALYVGYKLRQQISKSLQHCSAAIRKAIQQYNTLATALTLPCPVISWKDIVNYTFLGEFDFLHQSDIDIQDFQWAKPAICEATTKFFKLSRAKEALVWLEVEMCCLHTAIHDEEKIVFIGNEGSW